MCWSRDGRMQRPNSVLKKSSHWSWSLFQTSCSRTVLRQYIGTAKGVLWTWWPELSLHSRSAAKICWHKQFWRPQRSPWFVQIRSGQHHGSGIRALEAEVGGCCDVRPSSDCCWDYGEVRCSPVSAHVHPSAAVPNSFPNVEHRRAFVFHHATAEIVLGVPWVNHAWMVSDED